MKKAIVSVTNDLTTDQRVDRVCRTLVKADYSVLLVGRQLPESLKLDVRPYRTKRMQLLFRKGPLFYAEYNIRLFLFLLIHKTQLQISNDLDTLPANYLASIITKRTLLHDCHEYFRGVPELNGRSLTTKIWKWIEDSIFPRLKEVYAVNGSIADIYHKEYGNNIHVIRNVPFKKEIKNLVTKSDLNIPEEHKVIIYQGAVNVDRGIEEAILAMKHVKTPATLIIAGIGDVFAQVQELVKRENLEDTVRVLGQIPLEKLHGFTQMADLGLSIEKDVSLNYHFCLPNKFLDYIQAKIPVLISPLPEMKAILDRFQIGEFIENHDPIHIAAKMDAILNDNIKLPIYKQNLEIAAAELCWENEQETLLKILLKYA